MMEGLARMSESVVLDSMAIRKLIPHRYPFLLVDTIIELDAPTRGVGLKCVSANEPFFQGHFPEFPIMPGVLIVEALAQVGGVTLMSSGQFDGQLGLFAGIDNVRFKRQVKPGDVLRLEMTLSQVRRNICSGSGVATVNGELACRGDLMFALVPDPIGASE
jgi:3-hydroxyacyl-[acyl-carrier-protein] dehydratase